MFGFIQLWIGLVLREDLISSGWFQAPDVAEDGFEFLTLMPPAPESWGYRCEPPFLASNYLYNKEADTQTHCSGKGQTHIIYASKNAQKESMYFSVSYMN